MSEPVTPQTNLPDAIASYPNPQPNVAANGCAACQAARRAGAKFCPHCGRPLKPAPLECPTGERAGGQAMSDVKNPEPTPRHSEPDHQARCQSAVRPAPATAPPPAEPTAVTANCHCDRTPADDAPPRSPGDIPAETPAAEAYWVTWIMAGRKPLCIRFDGEQLTIGKTPNNDLVTVGDNYVSRQHARLFKKDGKIVVEDLGSSNGTLLRLRRPIELEVGDEILVGTSVLRLQRSLHAASE